MNSNRVKMALSYVRGKTYPIEFECDNVCCDFMLNSVRFEVTDNVWHEAKSCCTYSLNDPICEKIREYSF